MARLVDALWAIGDLTDDEAHSTAKILTGQDVGFRTDHLRAFTEWMSRTGYLLDFRAGRNTDHPDSISPIIDKYLASLAMEEERPCLTS